MSFYDKEPEEEKLLDSFWRESASEHHNIECWSTLNDKANAVDRLFDLLESLEGQHWPAEDLAKTFDACVECTYFLLFSQVGLKVSDDGWWINVRRKSPFTTVAAALNIEPTEKESYEDYLQSDVWQRTRELALEYYGSRCCLCNSNEKLNVHHRTYEHKGNERLADLIVLCRDCHASYHSVDA